MSRPYVITDTPERKMDVSVDATGAVSIVKKWLEMIINGDEWERINEARAK